MIAETASPTPYGSIHSNHQVAPMITHLIHGSMGSRESAALKGISVQFVQGLRSETDSGV